MEPIVINTLAAIGAGVAVDAIVGASKAIWKRWKNREIKSKGMSIIRPKNKWKQFWHEVKANKIL